MTTPSTVIDYDIASRNKTVRKVDEVANYDASKYVVSRLWAKAADGVEIPVSVVRRKDVAIDGKAPLLLTGYGSYGFSYPVTFGATRVSLLDRGVIFAIGHVRGGGEMGKKWHDMGRMEHKRNTFTDFIAVAEHLIANKYTTRAKLMVTGGSAGGLLMGAISNLRPDLFGLVVSHVPFVDVLNTMLNDKLPLTVGEYEEWGNPNKRADYFRIKSYGPYTNITEKNYPPMLIKTSLNDSQVMYWEPAKYVAKLRAHKTDKNKIIFKTNMAGGHGGSSGRLDRYHETAFDYAFMLWHVGIHE
jgi:oligopeptidase B